MRLTNKLALALFAFFLCQLTIRKELYAQLPACSATGGFVYVHSGNDIYNWDPTQPLSATNPALNTISMPGGAIGLAVSENLNSATGPSPTFYTVVSGNYYYYDGTAWVNTGHTAGAVNPGGGGGFLYCMEGGGGNVYKYDGTANATLALTVPGFMGGGPFDIVADCAGNFYVLRTESPAWLRKYSPAGTLLQEWTVVGAPSIGSGGGFAIIGNMMYHHNSGLHEGVIGATTVNVTPVTGTFPSPGDFGSCPIGGGPPVAGVDTLFNCVPGAPLSITASGTTPFSYTVINGSATVTGTGPSFSVTNTQPATIVLQSTSNSLCSSGTTTDTFLIVPAPVVNAGPDDTVFGCATYIDTLQASLSNTTPWVNYSYSWEPAAAISSGANTTAPVIIPPANTTYTLTVSTSAAQGNCAVKDSLLISVKDESVLPDYSFVVKYGCTADTVFFTNTSFQGTKSFWDFDDGTTDTATNPTHIYTPQGSYNAKLIASNYMCMDSVIKIVNTQHPLIASYTVDKDTLCEENTVMFTNASTISVQPGSFFWDFADGGTSTAMNPTHYYAVPGTYNAMLVATDGIPCYDTTYHIIVVDSIPSLDFTIDDRDICIGQSINVNAQYTRSGNEGLDWDFGDNTTAHDTDQTSHAYDIPGTYYVQLTARYRVCDDMNKKDSVNVHELPLVNLGKDSALCLDGNPLFISNLAPGHPGDHYLWSTGDTSATLKVVHHGTYNLLVTTAFDCTNSDEVVIDKDCYIDVPNSFTPNGDGHNDYFFPRQLLSKNIAGFSLQVFNRWGQMVYETTNPDGRGWDGKFNSKDQPSGVYIYRISTLLSNSRVEQYTGNVTLLR